jgi:MoaA/NifB/PqqE/SkfB family radical SAM enzyme
MKPIVIIKNTLARMNLLRFVRSANRKYKRLKWQGARKNILKRGYPASPKVISIEPTSRCNLRCKMCYLDFSKMDSENDIDIDKFKFIIDQLPERVKLICFTGGEPLISTDFSKMLAYASEKKLLINIQSNLINTVNVEELKKYRSNIFLINTSIDGSQDYHNHNRGKKNAYQLTKSGIDYIVKNFPMGTVMPVCVIQGQEKKELKALIDLGAELGLHEVEYELERRADKATIEESASILGYAKSDFRLKEVDSVGLNVEFKELREMVDSVIAYGKEKGVKVRFLPEDLPKNLTLFYNRETRSKYNLYCDALNLMRIDSCGNVFSCIAVKKSFGSVFKNSITDIWKSKVFVKFRQNLIRNNLMPICETCFRAKKLSPK